MRLREQLARAQTLSMIGMIAGIGAAVAGARAGGSAGNIGAAAILAPQSAIQRSLLAYARTQEDQADHAASSSSTPRTSPARAWSICSSG